MDTKKLLIAILAGFAAQMCGNYLVHSVWLKDDYVGTAQLWRMPDEITSRIWAIAIAALVYVIGAALIYAKGIEDKPWLLQGLRFGILLTMVQAFYSNVIMWVVMPIPHELSIKMLIGDTVTSFLLALVLAAIYRPQFEEA